MLAQNFKTAADLGIKDAEFEALIKVLGMLERQELPHARKVDALNCAPTSKCSFHMSISTEHHDCGTVACIGGWAASIMDREGRDYVNYGRSDALAPLFFPPGYLMDIITPDHAAVALRTYLSTGDVEWHEAIEPQ